MKRKFNITLNEVVASRGGGEWPVLEFRRVIEDFLAKAPPDDDHTRYVVQITNGRQMEMGGYSSVPPIMLIKQSGHWEDPVDMSRL